MNHILILLGVSNVTRFIPWETDQREMHNGGVQNPLNVSQHYGIDRGTLHVDVKLINFWGMSFYIASHYSKDTAKREHELRQLRSVIPARALALQITS